VCGLCTEKAWTRFGTEPNFIKGTGEMCAKIECPKNLWEFNKGLTNTHYAGALICSAAKENIWTTEQMIELGNDTTVDCVDE
ncbi:hypothetical protein PFISCL1PPCAC_24967, partial [Pristionchus fissidentatus]